MQQSECMQLLRTQYLKDTKQKNNLSKLTNQAWGEKKSEATTSFEPF